MSAGWSIRSIDTSAESKTGCTRSIEARILRPRATKLRFLAVLAVAMATAAPLDPCAEFDALYAQIRDQTITRDAARRRVTALIPEIRGEFYARGGTDSPPESWRFPLQGYGAEAIGGKNGSGYMLAGYDWFDGYKSRGHPGHDLFIHDRNRDELDDLTGRPVTVVSMTTGIVVATALEWKADSVLRGGRYIYIYSIYTARSRTVSSTTLTTAKFWRSPATWSRPARRLRPSGDRDGTPRRRDRRRTST